MTQGKLCVHGRNPGGVHASHAFIEVHASHALIEVHASHALFNLSAKPTCRRALPLVSQPGSRARRDSQAHGMRARRLRAF